MVPYRIYQAVTDQRRRDPRADARRHELSTAARNTPLDQPHAPSRLGKAAGRLLSLLHARDRATDRPDQATAPGPMGCIA